jgi:hypothetical protein
MPSADRAVRILLFYIADMRLKDFVLVQIVGLPGGGHAPQNPTDPGDLMGKYSVYGIKPDPCGDDKLALTHKSAVEAGVSSKHRLSGDFGRLAPRPGVIMDSAARKSRLLNTHSWDTSDFHPPASYDARGKDQIGRMCAAAQIGDQKNCASCYAFAAAKIMAYRLCLASNGVYDYEVRLLPFPFFNSGPGASGGIWSTARQVWLNLAPQISTTHFLRELSSTVPHRYSTLNPKL